MKAKTLSNSMKNNIIDTVRIMKEIRDNFKKTDDGNWYTVDEYTVAYFWSNDIERIIKDFDKIKEDYFN